jgi:hypothetical protein
MRTALFLACQDGHLIGGERFTTRGSKGDAPDKSCAFEPGAVGREGQECVTAWTTSSARGAVFYPQDGARQVREAGGEAVPDHLGGQTLDHLVAPILGQITAQDHGGVTGVLARVDPYPAPPHPVTVALSLVYVVVQRLHSARPLLA